VKAIVAVGLLAVIAGAGCGGAKKTVSRVVTNSGTVRVSIAPPFASTARPTITVIGRASMANVKTGTLVRCKGWPTSGVKVPPRGQGVVASVGKGTVSQTGTRTSSSVEIRLMHRPNGSISVVCRPSG
jgi:hypothetical protein